MSNSVLIIGNKGYIGSALYKYLIDRDCIVQGVDLRDGIDCRDLSDKFISDFDAVVHLGGLSNVADCTREFYEVFQCNLLPHVEFLHKLRPDQKYIYASTASVYGGNSRNRRSMENDFIFCPNHSYDATKMMMDIAAQTSGKQYYGLRFATVCGPSSVMRMTMLNAMVENAMEKGEISITNPNINRPILGINDLTRAIESIIAGGDNRGIYNLASWNCVVADMAEAVIKFFVSKGKSIISHIASEPSVYDFAIDTSKFKATYNFSFKETPQTVIGKLYDHYNKTL